FHSLFSERSGVLDGLFADLAKARIDGGIISVGGFALEDTARAELRLECRVLRIVLTLRLLLGIEVVEIAEELIEPVCGRQKFVAVAEMVLSELAGGVTKRFQCLGDGDVRWLQARCSTGQAHFGHSGAQT